MGKIIDAKIRSLCLRVSSCLYRQILWIQFDWTIVCYELEENRETCKWRLGEREMDAL